MTLLEKLNDQEIFKRLSSDAVSTETNIRHSKIAVRNPDETFFAHNSTIRCTKISTSQNYKLLDVPEIDFDIQGLLMNTSGTLLAVYNEHNIFVCTLPSSNFMNTSDSLLKVKSFRVGAKFFSSVSIKDITWNNTGRFDSNLVILSSDGLVRAFDLSTSYDEPENSYDLTSPPHHQVGLVSNSISDPVSMTFGSVNTLAGALTLYILNSDGDVFSLYPFLPNTLVASKDSVEDLLNETVLLTNDIVESSNIVLRRQAIDQLKFVKSLWKQIATAPIEIRSSKELCVLKPEISGKTSIQGPYAIQCYPESLYDDSALTITTIPCGSISLLAITFSDNGFAILLQDPRHTMRFQDTVGVNNLLLGGNGDDDTDNTFLSLSLIDFKTSSKTAPCMITRVGKTTLLQRGNEIFELGFSRWIELFDDIVVDGDIERLMESKSSTTDIRLLKTLTNGEVYEGAFWIENEFGEGFRCIITNKSFDIFQGSKAKELTKTNEDSIPSIPGAKLGTAYFEIEKLVQQVRNTKIIQPTNSSTPLIADENSLRQLNDVSAQVTKQLITFHKLGLALNYKVINQKTELERQLNTTCDLTKRYEIVDKQSNDCSQKISSYIERQEAITKRFQSMADKLQKGGEVPLSVSEKSWFKEIQKLAVSFNKSAKQNMLLNEQLTFIKSEIDSKASATEKVRSDVGEWDSINQILSEGRDIVNKTSATLDQNLLELNTRMKEARI